jgi:hypothetical protein
MYMYTCTCNCDWSTSSLIILAWYRHSMKSGGVKLALWTSISSTSEMMRSCKYFLHVGKLSNLTYNWVAKKTKTPPPKKKPPNPNSWLIIGYVTRELYDGCHLWSRNCLIPSCPPEFTPVFSGIRVAQSLFVCVVFCRLVLVSTFILFVLVIVFCPVPFTVSDFSWTYYIIHLFFVVQKLSYVYV